MLSKTWKNPPRTALSTNFLTKARAFSAKLLNRNGERIASSIVSTFHALFILLSAFTQAAIFPVLEHSSMQHRQQTVDHLAEGLLEYATHEQASKCVTKALKEGGKEVVDKVVKRMCEPAKGYV